jgi:cellulose synthase/poly-beta-1,6-N-acetylglucosamine synthase-like glycosyltransferase
MMIVVPTLGDRLDYLERALSSCDGFIEYANVSVYVVLPKSAKDARKIVDRHGAIAISDPGKGMAAAINAALQASQGESLYVWLGDDDELNFQGVLRLMEALENDPGAVLAFGYCEYVDASGKLIGVNRGGLWAVPLLRWGPNLVPHPGTVVRVSELIGIGGFDEGLSFAMDLDLFLRLRGRGRFIHRQVVSARFRWHPNSATVSDRRASSREAMMVKKRHLPKWLRGISALWNYPVAWTSLIAAIAVSSRAERQRP